LIEIPVKNERVANAIKDSLLPDNVKIPKGLSIEIKAEKDQLIIEISSEVKLQTFIGTVDEIFEHINIGKELLSSD
jgi:tRNA threonylcarbamoyladenosine modification (KEOPS) complex  Pcc1 subunit